MRPHVIIFSILTICANLAVSFPQEITLPVAVAKHQAALPETVLYSILLHQVAAFKDKADQLDREGGDGSPYRHHIATKLGLNPQEMLCPDSVALQYRTDAEQTEEQIAESVKSFQAYHATLPSGVRPPLPPEAKFLLEKRAQIVLQARDRFHNMVGDAEFGRIDALVKSRFQRNIQFTPETRPLTTPTPQASGSGGNNVG